MYISIFFKLVFEKNCIAIYIVVMVMGGYGENVMVTDGYSFQPRHTQQLK